MLSEVEAAVPGCTCLMPQHCSWGCEMPSLVNPHQSCGVEISLGFATALWSRQRKKTLSRGCKAGWAISRGLQVLGHHTMLLMVGGQHRVTLTTSRTNQTTPSLLSPVCCKVKTAICIPRRYRIKEAFAGLSNFSLPGLPFASSFLLQLRVGKTGD